MKKTAVILIFAVMIVFTAQAHAALELLGQGSSEYGTWNLIYDDHLDVTWYDYTKSTDSWDDQVEWAEELAVAFGDHIYDDWRLPETFDIGGDGCNFSYSGTDCGYNVDTSTGELQHLWYDELGNTAYYNENGVVQPGWGMKSTGDFENLQGSWYYYTGTVHPGGEVWVFETDGGSVDHKTMDKNNYAIAVRDGMAVAPEPVSTTLFLVGGATLGFRRFKEKFKA